MQKYFSFFILLFLFVSCDSEPSFLQKKYAHTNGQWFSDIEKIEREDKLNVYPDSAILFIGSSSIAMWKSIHEDMQPFSVIQHGYGGASYSDAIHYIERLVKPHPAQAIVFFIANDIRGVDDDKTPEETLELFKETIRLARKSHSKTPFIVISTTPTKRRWKVVDEIKKANELIRNYCVAQPNLYFVDIFQDFLTSEQQPRTDLFREDQLHLNKKGYQRWTSLIKPEIIRILKQS